jgi:ubiquitin carboxyl-terminal hydrolase 8
MKAFKEFENGGLTGLSNLGNTCFINATCQIISHTYELTKFLNKGARHLNEDCIDTKLVKEWEELRKMMYSENCTIRPAKFVHSVQQVAKQKNNELFSEFSQNDVPEFFLFIVDCFHNAMKRKADMRRKTINTSNTLETMCFELMKRECEIGEYSEMIDLFYGIHLSQLQSLDFQTTYSVKAEQFNIINLAITDYDDNDFDTLQECFDNYVKGEILDGDNQWFNENENKKMVVQRTIRYWSLPQILVIDLKRYNERSQKTRTLIDFPIVHWDLSKYVENKTFSTSYVYDLYAICNHSGIVLGGHYTAMVLNANGQWYEIDDGCVSPISETSLITSKAYCLFYRKRNK